MMGTSRPHLLTIDDPVVADQVCASGCAGEVRAAAGLAEELAPSVFASEDAAQELLFLQIRSMLEQRGSRQQPHSRLRDADRAYRGKFLLHHAREAHWQTAAVPCLRPLRHPPARVG